MQNNVKIALIILTYNAEQDIPALFAGVMQQTLTPDTILVIDSSSKDKTQALLSNYLVNIHTIPQSEFDHGGTRKLATELVDADIYIYLTQDAIPANENAFKEIVATMLREKNVACAYGRQLPKHEATPISAHSRLFNYPAKSQIRSYSDRARYGIKTCFSSDSFAAYKKIPLQEIGNFPANLISSEDAYVAGKLLKQGYAIAYVADALVYHSHNLSIAQEFHRYFSIGVFHGRENWILKDFASATGEGFRFVKSELKYLWQHHHYTSIPRAFVLTIAKLVAYKLGLYEQYIPLHVKKKLGVNKSFWLKSTIVESYDHA